MMIVVCTCLFVHVVMKAHDDSCVHVFVCAHGFESVVIVVCMFWVHYYLWARVTVLTSLSGLEKPRSWFVVFAYYLNTYVHAVCMYACQCACACTSACLCARV